MNRRLFLKVGIFSAGALTLPLLHCRSKKQYNDLLQQPSLLSQICDEKTLREIGLAYRKLKPAEDKLMPLINFLSVDSSGEKINSKSSDTEVKIFIENKIHTDFENNDTIIVKGWVLAHTEARQCALFSLT